MIFICIKDFCFYFTFYWHFW